ncbi:MAG: hypothetical protein JW739_03735 [Opitutales bacterium]|nr:hypothetical protein [Opitutales bacterium]
MSASGKKLRRRLFLLPLFILGIAVHIVGFICLRMVPYPEPSEGFRDPFVRFIGDSNVAGHPVMQEQAVLFDSAPLFLPTKWNTAGVFSEVNIADVQTPLFGLYEEQITLNEDTLSPAASYVAFSRPDITNVLGESSFPALRYFGRKPDPLSESVSSADMILQDMMTGQTLSGGTLPQEIQESIYAVDASYSEWLVHADVSGVVGQPMRLKGSGNIEVDHSIRNFLQDGHFIKPLQIGYFHVVIGP